ncbi:MAG: hypothetical protein WC878_00420 [Candidatus Paceibacterota bacterium]|jgi:hypothetical protein
MNNRRQTETGVRVVEQRVLDRRELDKIKNERDGYVNRNTKLPLYFAVFFAAVFLVGGALFFYHAHVQQAANLAQANGLFVSQEKWVSYNFLEIVSHVMLAVSGILGFVSFTAHFLIKAQNEREFEFELKEVNSEIARLKNYRKTTGQGTGNRRELDRIKNERDGYVNRNTKFPFYFTVFFAVVFFVGVALFFAYTGLEEAARLFMAQGSRLPHETMESYALLQTISYIALVISGVLGVAGYIAYLSIRTGNEKEFELELEEVNGEIARLKNYRKDDEKQDDE